MTSLCGSLLYEKFNGLSASFCWMGIIPDAIAMAAFTQHSRAVSDVDPVIVEAIQGKRGLGHVCRVSVFGPDHGDQCAVLQL